MLLFYLELGEVTPSSLGSPVHFLVSVDRTTRAGYESGSKVQHRNSISVLKSYSDTVWHLMPVKVCPYFTRQHMLSECRQKRRQELP